MQYQDKDIDIDIALLDIWHVFHIITGDVKNVRKGIEPVVRCLSNFQKKKPPEGGSGHTKVSVLKV